LDGVHSQIERPAPPKLTPQNQGTKFDRFQNRFRSVDRNDVTDSDLIFQDQEELLIMPRTTVCASNPTASSAMPAPVMIGLMCRAGLEDGQ